jgi:hypothetical protein
MPKHMSKEDKAQDKALLKGKSAKVKKEYMKIDKKMDKPSMSKKMDIKKDKAILKSVESKFGKFAKKGK